MSNNNLVPVAAATTAARGVAPETQGVNAAATTAAHGLLNQTAPLAGSLGSHVGGVPPVGAPSAGAGLGANANPKRLADLTTLPRRPSVGGGGVAYGPGNLNPAVPVVPIRGGLAGGNAIPGINNLGVVDTLALLVEEATPSDPTQTWF
jgi:hypothetical protein